MVPETKRNYSIDKGTSNKSDKPHSEITIIKIFNRGFENKLIGATYTKNPSLGGRPVLNADAVADVEAVMVEDFDTSVASTAMF